MVSKLLATRQTSPVSLPSFPFSSSSIWLVGIKRTVTKHQMGQLPTVGASGSSFVWTGVPYPLRWIQTGLYQLELRPLIWERNPAEDTANDDGPPLLAQSSFFTIGDPGPEEETTTTTDDEPDSPTPPSSVRLEQHLLFLFTYFFCLVPKQNNMISVPP